VLSTQARASRCYKKYKKVFLFRTKCDTHTTASGATTTRLEMSCNSA
jgi:hypothetical protein